MRRIVLFLTLVVMAHPAITGCSPSEKDYVGTWTNDHGDLALLSNGHGVIGGVALRWRKTDKGIRVIAGVDGSSMERKFIFNERTGTLVVDGDKEMGVWHKIKNAEPWDYEGEIEQQQKQQIHDAKNTLLNITTNTYKNIEDVYAAIKLVSTNKANMTLASEDNSQRIQWDSYNGHTFLKIQCRKAVQPIHKGDDDFWGDQPPPVLHSNWASTPPKASLSETVFVSEERTSELKAWLKEKNVEPDFEYLVDKSRWRVEGYTLYCSLHTLNDPDKTIEVAEFLRKHTLAPFEGPYKLTIIPR